MSTNNISAYYNTLKNYLLNQSKNVSSTGKANTSAEADSSSADSLADSYEAGFSSNALTDYLNYNANGAYSTPSLVDFLDSDSSDDSIIDPMGNDGNDAYSAFFGNNTEENGGSGLDNIFSLLEDSNRDYFKNLTAKALENKQDK